MDTVNYPMSKKNPDPMIFQNNLTKTNRLSMIFGRQDCYSFAYWFRVQSLIRVENHLHCFHINSSTIAW